MIDDVEAKRYHCSICPHNVCVNCATILTSDDKLTASDNDATTTTTIIELSGVVESDDDDNEKSFKLSVNAAISSLKLHAKQLTEISGLAQLSNLRILNVKNNYFFASILNLLRSCLRINSTKFPKK